MSGDPFTKPGTGSGAEPERGSTPGVQGATSSQAAAAPTTPLIPVGRPLSAMRRPMKQVGDDRQKVQESATQSASFYDQIGGHETFTKLVHEFYKGVAADPEFRAMYPEQDLGPAERRLRMFLEQYWGGPTTYSEERGHPRLRMRHVAFRVDSRARDTWLKHMRAAVDTLELSPLHEGILWDYLERAAHSLVNAPD